MSALKHLFIFLFAVLISISACVAPGANSFDNAEDGGKRYPESEGLPLTFNVSGGFAGRIESLEINADGMARFTDKRRHMTRSQQLIPLCFVRLQSLLAAIPEAKIGDGGSRIIGSCPDCIEYRLTINLTAKSREIFVHSNRLVDSEYRELIGLLISIGNDVKQVQQ